MQARLLRTISLAGLCFSLCAACLAADLPEPTLTPLVTAVDLNVGESADVSLSNGNTVRLKLLDLQETRDQLRDAVRQAEVTVEVGGQKVAGLGELSTAHHGRPVQIDCPVTQGLCRNNSKTASGKNPGGSTRTPGCGSGRPARR